MKQNTLNSKICSQLLQQSNKIKKISASVSKSHPEIAEEMDKILYAAIRIEKTAKKVQDACNCSVIDENFRGQKVKDNDDALFSEAQRSMGSLNTALSKLSRKVSIVINEAHFHHHPRQDGRTEEKKRTRSKNGRLQKSTEDYEVLKSRDNIKTENPKIKTEHNYRNELEFQQIEEQDDQNLSKSLNAIDEEIIDLVNEMRKNGIGEEEIEEEEGNAEELLKGLRRIQEGQDFGRKYR